MRRWRVEWAQPAEGDLDEIIGFLFERSHPAAERSWKRLRRAAERLERVPERGRVVPELRRVGVLDYRELVVPPWRIVYRLSGRTVFVVGVLDARRDLEAVLLRRFG